MDYIIIVAGGKGLRMGSDIPKQFLPIGGKPVLMRTLERFREYSAELQIILVLPEAQQAYWRELCKQYNFPLPLEGAEGGFYQLANGGQTRGEVSTNWPMADRHASTLYRTDLQRFLMMHKAW